MAFHSFSFFVFFPVVCLVYYLVPLTFRTIFLLIASYYFYMCWNPKYALLLGGATLITWAAGFMIGAASPSEDDDTKTARKKKGILAAAVLVNLGLLFFYKYIGFAASSISSIMTRLGMQPLNLGFDIVLPAGISFFTFQVIGYVVDVYRGKIQPEKNILRYALYISFFPKLAQGPIERADNFLQQLHVKQPLKWDNVESGLFRMLVGFFQKLVIADNLSVFIAGVYGSYPERGSIELLVATVFFAIQLYCDFSGYTNIAVGAAKVMGFSLVENFNVPYMADSIADFWRRWHISLNIWFRNYVYIPLGGNRKGKIRKYINIMIVFLASGLWHGASWHFVAWGAVNGMYQIIGDVLMPVRRKVKQIFHVDDNAASHKVGKIMITFILVNISWVFFRANSMRDSFSILWRIATKWNLQVLSSGVLYTFGLNQPQLYMVLVSILILIIFDLIQYRHQEMFASFCKQGAWMRVGLALFLLFWILIFGSYGPQYNAADFIYSQF